LRLDLMTNGAPLCVVGALAVLAYGLARRRSIWLPLLGVGGLAAGLPLMVPELVRSAPSSQAAPGGPKLNLIEFNAWGANPTPGRAASWLVSQHPDIIVMEDVGPELATDLRAGGYRFTRGIDDTAIFSLEPPSARRLVVPPRLWPYLPSFARATFDIGAHPFSVIGVHLERPYHQGAMSGAAALGSLVSGLDHRSLIVAGDFNLTPWSFELRRLDADLALERRDRALASWPAVVPHAGGLVSPAPLLPIDHVYAGSDWRTDSIRLGPNLGSDHYPVIVTLSLPSGTEGKADCRCGCPAQVSAVNCPETPVKRTNI
jgi:endonuclease/exonuclease/phosphatase (EEP) superfamily protein YafD